MNRLGRMLFPLSVAVLTIFVCQAAAAGKKGGTGDDALRAKYAATITKKWGVQITRRYGMSPAEWTDAMIGTFSSSDLANLRRAAEAKSFNGMSGALFGGSSAENIVRTGGNSTLIGSTENDLVFTPLPPCRVVDTRVAGGVLSASATRSFQGWTTTDFISQGGSSTNCGVPENASAILANVVAVNTVNRVGYLTAYPSNTNRPNAASINFVGSDVANQLVLKLCRPGCQNQFTVFSTSQTHVVVDVYGYFMEPVATPLDCTTVTEQAPLLNLNFIDVTASCPSGYAATGGGCGGPIGLSVGSSRAAVDENGRPTGWTCSLATSIIGGLLGSRVDATCCRVPGR